MRLQNFVPILKTVGKTILKGTTNFAEDAIDGKNVKESAKRRFEESLDELSDKAGVMRGNGFKRPINKKRKIEKNKRKKNKEKRDFDIFDRK